MSQPAVATSASHCPLCGQTNRCVMELARATGQPQEPCWCTQVRFEPALLASMPAEAVNKACICARCAGAALSTP